MEKSIDMLGLIGGGLGLANSMFGGIKAAKERKRQDRIIREAKQRNEDFFNSEYYQNYMDRSDVQAAMKRVRDTMRKSNQTAAASAAVLKPKYFKKSRRGAFASRKLLLSSSTIGSSSLNSSFTSLLNAAD